MSEFEDIFKAMPPKMKKKVLTKQGKRLSPAGTAPKPPSFTRSLGEPGEEIYCPTCGAEAEVVEKGGKKKLKHKGKGALALGNEMSPHKGPASGQTTNARGGRQSPQVDRAHAGKPKSGVVKSEEAPDLNKALFPSVGRVQLVTYTGATEDNALAQQIQDSQDPTKPHKLYTPSQRNLALEREQAANE